MGDLSPHFATDEFRCHHCGAVVVTPELVAALERLRLIVKRPLRIVSGFRCPTHNAAVGGAPQSQHIYGRAADLVAGVCRPEEAVRAGFRGVGVRGSYAVHVDVRQGALVVFPD